MRVARHREKKRGSNAPVTPSNGDVTQGNESVTQSATATTSEAEAVPTTSPRVSAKPKGVSEGKGSDMVPTTEQSKRIASVFHRKHTTAWTPQEIKAYKSIGTLPEEDLQAVERYYADNWPPRRDVNILRHDLITFLNNFAGEVDRAHAAKTKPKNNRTMEWTDSRPKLEALPDPVETERIRAQVKAQAQKLREAM